jgi:hypothetical protein
MSTSETPNCPECTDVGVLDRRNFIRVVGGSAALLAGGVAPVLAQAPAQAPAVPAQPAPAQPAQPAKQPRPAEALIRELHAGLTAEQKRQVELPWNSPNRHRTYNAPMGARISAVYTRPQQELLTRIMRAISSGDEGFNKLARGGNWDQGGGFVGGGANFFGSFDQGQQWAWVYTGHHLTVRCDGDSEPDAAFGGPMYYGHSPDGHSQRNVFNYQTRSVISVFNALTAAQRGRAVLNAGAWADGAQAIAPRRQPAGLVASDLTADQKRLVETVMRELLSPYRREDADEVMALIKRNGGLERLHLAFYRDQGAADQTRFSYWRIEGPGFIWNYRVLPHVHCYVNVMGARMANG